MKPQFFYGVLSISLVLSIAENGRLRVKKVNLCNISCAYNEAPAKFCEFKDANPNLDNDLRAEFVFRRSFEGINYV
jgi:hypothetical protein